MEVTYLETYETIIKGEPQGVLETVYSLDYWPTKAEAQSVSDWAREINVHTLFITHKNGAVVMVFENI